MDETRELPKTNEISLELGDIIEIVAPSNTDIHEMTAIITYINGEKVVLVDVASLKPYQLNIGENGSFTDETITEINLLSRPDQKGYARQNDLLPKTWVDIYFGGDIPAIITGEITNLEEDMIELTTYPELEVIYIDFEYKGLPETIPIDKIVIREKPASIRKVGSLALIRQELEEGEVPDYLGEEEVVTYVDNGDAVIRLPKDVVPDENIRDVLNNLYIEANEIVFGEKLGAVQQVVEVPEGQQRYDVEKQVNNLMDELLSNIPNSRRTKGVLDNIHLLIQRFKQLREHFSNFDENENVYEAKTYGAYYKPLVERIDKLDTRLQWLIPVVCNRKKIYDIDVEMENQDIIQEKIGDDIGRIENVQNEYYKNVSKTRTMNYTTLNNTINNIVASYEDPFDNNKFLTSKRVMTNLEAIIDNLDNFYSTIVNADGMAKRRFIIQKYNLGLTKLDEQIMKNGKKIFKRIPMTPNDKITIKSLLILPAPVVMFSKIDLPTTSIMERANLHHNLFMTFRLLRKKTDIIPHVIDDLQKEFDHEQWEKDTQKDFFSGIQEFILSEDVSEDPEKYQKFLEAIVPKTRTLIRLVRKYIKDKLSFVDVAQHLEPFAIYPDHITYQQHKEIRYFIKKQIEKIKIDYVQRRDELSILRNTNYNVDPKPKTILSLISEKREFMDDLYQSYRFLLQEKDEVALSSQEILFKMLQLDNHKVYCNLMNTLLLPSLVTPDFFTDAFGNKPAIEEMTDIEKITPPDCYKRYLAKRYTSMKDLQKDNNAEDVFYDKEFDDTPYDILKKYKDEQKKMPPEKFVSYLTENLIQKHDCPTDFANDLAIILIQNKKKVSDGEYAILEIRPQLDVAVDEQSISEKNKAILEEEAELRKRVQYYRRLKNNWVRDNEINEEAFLDTNTIFCNISSKCMKNQNTAVCETTKDASDRLKEINQKGMMKEFENRYEENIDDMERKLEKNLSRNRAHLVKLQSLYDIQAEKANNLAYELGKYATYSDTVVSPHVKLRDLILGQDDFTKKQGDIIRFVETFCRDPMINELEENQYWKYCIDTNTKLMPWFLYELAKEFVNGGDYALKQQQIRHAIGIPSDDADAIVDRHSGYIICKGDFSEEEGFDQSGFKITTHAIMEKEMGTVMMEVIGKKEKRVFDNETSESIYNVFSTICSNIDIQVDGIEDFVLSMTNELMAKVVVKENKYNERSEKQLKEKGKGLQPYENYRKETLITLTASVLLVRIQTAVPSFKTTKTFPGCVRSFSGYPLNGGVEDMTAIQYISCVLEKTKSSISPWESIKKLKANDLATRIRTILDVYVLKRSDINELYVQKREYVLLNPDTVSVEEHSISKWKHFLPPVVEFSILGSLKNVGSDFNKDLLDIMRKGHKDQHQQYAILKSRAQQFGFAVVEGINNVVKNKDLLFKTSAQIPFMENACCNEGVDTYNPILYFIKEDENIRFQINAVRKMSKMLENMRVISTAPMLYHPEFTGIKYPAVAAHDLEKNVYAAIIKYCNFDRKLPVPEELKTICSEKPANYNQFWSLDEKIEFLKKNGKRYNVDTLHQLMKIVNGNNRVVIEANKPFNRVDSMKNVVEALDTENSSVVVELLRDHLRNVIETFNPAAMKEDDTPEMEGLINYLYTANDKLYRQVMSFIEKYGKLSNANYDKMNQYLFDLTKWNLDTVSSRADLYHDDELCTVAQYVQNAVHSMAKVYPNIILNLAENYAVPPHWGFNKKDDTTRKIETFIKKYYESIEKFKNDNVISRLLLEISTRLVNLNLFTQNIPVITPIRKDGRTYNALFDKKTTYALFSHCFLSAIYEYIECANDINLIRADLEEFKQIRREKISDAKDPANSIAAQFNELDESLVETEMDLQEYRVVQGNAEELKERVCQLILGFLEIEEKNKKAVNFSYEDIMHHVKRSRNKEKKSIVEDLGKMSIEERRVENTMKKYKMGRWNVGQQKGLVQYDAATNERETKDMIGHLLQDLELGTTDVVSEMMIEVYELALLDNYERAVGVEELDAHVGDETEGYYDGEGEDISKFGENFMDGEYYEEDIDPSEYE